MCGPDEILGQDVESLRTKDPRVVRDPRQREDEGGQDEVLDPVEDVQLVVPDCQHSDARQPPQLNGEDDDQDQAEPERRNGVPDDSEDADRAVDPLSPLERGEHAQGDTDNELQQKGRHGEHEGVRNSLHHHPERLAVIDERLAKVPLKSLRNPVDVLERDRLVEPVGVEQPEIVLLGEVPDAEGEEPDGIARRKARNRERDDRDANERGDRI